MDKLKNSKKKSFLQIVKNRASLYHYTLTLKDFEEIDHDLPFIKVPEMNTTNLESSLKILFQDQKEFSIVSTSPEAMQVIIRVPLLPEDLHVRLMTGYIIAGVDQE